MIPRVMHIGRDATLVWEAGMQANIFQTDALRYGRTPPEALNMATLLARLDQAARKCELEEMTVIIAGDMLAPLGFPRNPPADGAPRNKALETARAHHWEVADVGKWMSFRRPGTSGRKRAIHIGVAPWLSARNCKLWHKDEGIMISLLSAVQELTGVAYRQSAGVLGSAMLQNHYPGAQPMWHPSWVGVPPALDHVTERAYTDWVSPLPHHGRYAHSYDGHRAYLAAAIGSEASFGPLHHTHRRVFDRKIAGYWQVQVPVWNVDYLPHPMGPDRVHGQTVWTTTVTMGLLADLADRGVLEMPHVLDSFTAPEASKGQRPTTRRILREWATTLDRAADRARYDHPIPEHGAQLEDCLKSGYKEGIGMWVNETGRIHRPDISHDCLGRSRCNGFRKMWTAAEKGFFPARIHVDEFTYVTDQEDPYAAVPFTRIAREGDRPRLGFFKEPTTTETMAWT